MNIYEQIKDCAEEELFELVTSDNDLITDGIYEIIERYKSTYPNLESYYEYSDAGDCILKIDSILENELILVVSESLSTSDVLLKVLPKSEYKVLLQKYGYSFASNYAPVKVLPNLWSTGFSQLNSAIDAYANKVAPKHNVFVRVYNKAAKFGQYLLKHFWLFILGLIAFFGMVIIIG